MRKKSDIEKAREAQELILKALNTFLGSEGDPITGPVIGNSGSA